MQRLILMLVLSWSLTLPCVHAENFADTDIVSAIKAALDRNPEVLAAKTQIAASQRELASEQRRVLPTLSLSGETEGSRETEALAKLLQPIWVGGRITNAISQAEIELEMSRSELLGVQREIAEDTAAAFADLFGYQARIAAAEQNISEHETLLSQISRREQGRVVSGSDVELAKSRLSQAFLTKEELLGGQQTAMIDLATLTMSAVPENIPALTPVPQEMTTLADPGSVESEAVLASPGIAQAELSISLAQMEKELNKSELMPKVYGRLEQELYDRTSIHNQDLDTRLGLVVEASFEGMGLRQYEKVKASWEKIQKEKMNMEAQENEVRRRIRTLLADRRTIQGLLELYQALVKSTSATLASYSRQYDAGRKSWLDLLNIQQEHSRARLSLEQVKSSLAQNTLRIAARTGRLDKAAGISE